MKGEDVGFENIQLHHKKTKQERKATKVYLYIPKRLVYDTLEHLVICAKQNLHGRTMIRLTYQPIS